MAELSNLQKIGIISRDNQVSDYNKNNKYSEDHPNAISDGDVKGKGTLGGIASPLIPHKQDGIIKQLDTENGGSSVDIETRDRLSEINIYKDGDETIYSLGKSKKTQDISGDITKEALYPSDGIPGKSIRPTILTSDENIGSAKDRDTRIDLIEKNKYSKARNYYTIASRSAMIDIQDQYSTP